MYYLELTLVILFLFVTATTKLSIDVIWLKSTAPPKVWLAVKSLDIVLSDPILGATPVSVTLASTKAKFSKSRVWVEVAETLLSIVANFSTISSVLQLGHLKSL